MRDTSTGSQLSPQQQRLWLLADGGGGGPYRATADVCIRGPLRAAGLAAAVGHLVERHEILHTIFRAAGASALQFIASEAGVNLVEAGFDDGTGQPFDLARGPVLRATLARVGADDHQLRLVLPALCADRATLEQLVAELAATYATGGIAGQALPMGDDERLHYADVAGFQSEALVGTEAASGRSFWNRQRLSVEHLAPAPGAAAGSAGFIPAFQAVVLSADLIARLRHSAGDVSLRAMLFAAWAVLIARLDARRDLVIGAACGREDQEFRAVVGPLTRHVPVRIEVRPDETVAELAVRLDGTEREAVEWQEHFSWDRVAGAAAGSFFPVVFDVDPVAPPIAAAGVTFALEHADAIVDRFALRCFGRLGVNKVSLAIGYDASRFQPAEIERLCERFETLLGDVSQRPAVGTRHLELLGPVERRSILVDFSQTVAMEPGAGCAHALFEAQVARRGEAAAVTCGDEQLSYTELEHRAARLAQRLQELGVGPETRVGLAVDRSVHMVVGIIGILKAGGAYVPLDPGYPRDRLAFMLADSGARALVTLRRLVDALPGHDTPAVCLDELNDAGAAAVAPPRVHADNLAYVIYTSGSTGRPKGVAVSHRTLVHSTSVRPLIYHRPAGRFLLLSSFAFDSSVAGIFWTLSSGGTLVLPREGQVQDTGAIIGIIRDRRVTHTLLLPSVYELMLRQAAPNDLASLETVIVAGEACAPRLTSLHHQRLPGCDLFDEYGPTECTVWSSVQRIAEPVTTPSVPIGRPIPGGRIYLLDPAGRPVPVGRAGELYVGGNGVGRGYLARPDLTAERFVPDPFAGEPGARLYRTGDLARHTTGGTIEFLGRIDQQVKIRGYRIELGEIEARLTSRPDISEAAVVARVDSAGQTDLVAYVVASTSPVPKVHDLREHLKALLPDYMVPAAFVTIAALPRLPNGKVDRSALPNPESTRPELEDAFVAPRTVVEQLIAGHWREVLNLDEAGVFDNFFEVGGNSLKAAVIANRLRSEFGNTVDVAAMFQYVTIADLARHLQRLQPDAIARVGASAAPASMTKVTGRESLSTPDVDALSDEEVQARLDELIRDGSDDA